VTGIPRDRSKVFAYITNRDRLLVFAHPDHPGAGIQVPAGSLEHGETPREGVMREAFEETGLTSLRLVRFLGLTRFDARPYGRNEIHNRWFFHLECTEAPSEGWIHWERSPSDGGDPIRFAFAWLPLTEVHVDFGHDAMLHRLAR
jgi:8-oxo-dGTP pyrophosphatase MutT (NUDIX family)